jgi:tRNA dimethylallyltransferase
MAEGYLCSLMKKKLVVITGPTGSGKTTFAISLAKQLGTEIISADSRQVYREMKIGTARPSDEEILAAPHHLIGHRSIIDPYDAAVYAIEAKSIISSLFNKHQVLLLCGGTGLYIKALLEGLDKLPEIPTPIRIELLSEYEEKGLEWLQTEALKSDPTWYSKADQQNPRRLLRAVEVFRATGKPISQFQSGQLIEQHDWDIEKFVLELPRDTLYNRIDQRVLNMVDEGLFEEAKELYPLRHLNALQTVGYQEVFEYMDRITTKDQAIALIQQHTRNYAKRQLTWFRKEKDMTRLNPEDSDAIQKVLQQLKA